MLYADYSYYTETYGGKLEAEAYTYFGARASRLIDQLTFGRADHAPDIMADRIKWCCCELADELHLQDATSEQTGHGAIASESNDGYSVSYVARQEGQDMAASAKVCSRNLTWPVNLMWTGVC